MSDSLQHSILSYPSGAWDGATLTPVDGISSVENPEGLFDPDLSNYTTLHSNSGSLMRFTVSLTSGAMFLPGNATVGLIGVSDSSNATDQTEWPMNGILDVTAGTGFDTSQNHSRAVLFPTTIVNPTNPDIESSLLLGGQVNLIFNEVPRSGTGAGNVEFDVRLIPPEPNARGDHEHGTSDVAQPIPASHCGHVAR